MRWANEALELRFEKVNNFFFSFNKNMIVVKCVMTIFLQLQAERDMLHKKFVDAVFEVQQKTGLKNVLLQNKIAILNDNVEKQEAIIGELELVTDVSANKVNKKLEVEKCLKNF